MSPIPQKVKITPPPSKMPKVITPLPTVKHPVTTPTGRTLPKSRRGPNG